ncbi:hypothetical protein GA0070562_5102 [Micromonospora tulbaghiae]|uniref:Transcriptional regulator n=2 Tax=Micromonospora tulbaghiae TaxID=479978 RepID=A0ABY0KRG3_9ACTN|nr:hypothetical protein GA0070562_5102 [Micromonospora tulbaghiae]
MSRTELADAVNTALAQLYPDRNLTAQCVDHRWIGKLERGEHRWPSEERRAALRLVLGAASDADLGLYSPRRTHAVVSADHDGQVLDAASLPDGTGETLAQPQGVTSGDVRRRAVVTLGVIAAMAGAEKRLPDFSNGRARKIGVGDVVPLERSVRHLYSLDYQIGGGSLWQAAAIKVRDGYSMLEQGSYSSPTESRLLKVTARLEMCTGWLALDAGEHVVARTRFTEALILARQAQDREVETAALTYLAGQANSLNRPREALRFASSAAQVPTINQHPRLAAIPWLRLAVASSLTGDARGSEAALTNARRIVDRDSEKPAAEWCSFLSHTEIDGLHGTCQLTLGRPVRAEKLLDAAVSGYSDGYARNRALYRVRLAHARLLQGEPEGAAGAAHAALNDMVGEVASSRVSTEMAKLSQLFAAHQGVAEVDSFLDRYRKM